MTGELNTTTDLVVLVPGIMGSSLSDARGRPMWELSPGGLTRALRTLGGCVRELELPPDIGDGPARDGVVATGLIGGLHAIPGIWTPIAGYAGLQRFLGEPRFGLAGGGLVPFPYDWRLSNRWTATLLKARVDEALTAWRASAPERREAKVVFVCHSMGGLVARWYLDRLGGAEIARALVTIGTPHRGSLKGLEQLVNGVRKGLGPFKRDLTAFARSMPSAYELVPEYACIEGGPTGLLKTTEVDLPGLDPERLVRAMTFHDDLDQTAARTYTLLPFVGIGQPTWTSARMAGERLMPLDAIGRDDRKGDGTVPRLAARLKGMAERDPVLRGVNEGHGALAEHRSVLDELDFLLTSRDVEYRDAVPEPDEGRLLGVSTDDVHAAGETVVVTVVAPERRVLEVAAIDEHGREVAFAPVRFGRDTDATAEFERLAAGGYALMVRAPDDPAGVPPVTTTTLVLEA